MKRVMCAAALVLLVSGVAQADRVVQLPLEEIPKIDFPSDVAHDQTPLRVKVLVYEFNPYIPGELHAPDEPNAKPRRLGKVGGWNDSRKLAQGFIEDMCAASGGYVQFEIVEWNVVDAFQRKRDGYTYSAESYMEAKRTGNWHQPDGVDYHGEIRKYGMAKRIDRGEADEIWWFGLPYFGYWESVMIGPESFWINAPPQTDFQCKRRFAIMGWNSERGVAEMIHNVGHRTESAMKFYYNNQWNMSDPQTTWDHFSTVVAKGGAVSGVGHCHYPPNGEHDYDYSNPRKVKSTADDWLDYPDLDGATTMIDREAWGGPDYHRNYQKWFFTRLPKAPRVNPDGRENNWWKYIYNFNAYKNDHSGDPDPDAEPVRDREVERQGAQRPA